MSTVVTGGSTNISDIKAILTGYFECDTHLQSADDFYMLVVSVVEWLINVKPSNMHPDDLEKTLLSISKAINAMVSGLGTHGFKDVMFPPLPPKKVALRTYYEHMQYPFYLYGDNILRIMLRQEVSLSGHEHGINYLSAFGPLLHVIAEGFVKQVFFLAEEWPEYLHSALREVHIRGGCSDESCRWASHDYENHVHAECPLLFKTSPEVEASSPTSHSNLPPPVGQSHTPPRSSESISHLGDVSKEVEGTHSISHSSPVSVQVESRQQAESQSARDQSLGGDVQHDATAGVGLRRSSGDIGSVSYSLPIHIPQPATPSLLFLEVSSDAPPFLDGDTRPPVDIPFIDASHNVYDRHRDRGSSFEDHEPRDGATSTDIACDGPSDMASVDSNSVGVGNCT